MSVTNLEVVDAVSIDLMGNVVLSIADDLMWDNNNEHLVALQNKINVYLSIIESGSLYQDYPNAKDRNIVINVVAKYEPNVEGKSFLDKAKKILQSTGYGFEFKILEVE